jgi:hypothetical protein
MRHDASRSRAGFTAVEIVVAFTILATVFLIGIEMYTKGNRSSAKGAWRVQTVTSLRNGLRQISDLLGRSSYPSAIQLSNYFEAPANDWGLTLAAATTTAAAGGGTAYTYSDPRSLMTFYVSSPAQNTETSNVAGTAFRVTLALAAGTVRPANKNLTLVRDTAPVTVGGAGVQVGAFVAGTPTTVIGDVDSISLATTGTLIEKSILVLTVTCRDPFDGLMTLHETVKITVNVQIHIP